MRIIILSDIHGNMPALEVVTKNETWDMMLCLGDLVDYGPWPDEVIDYIMENADYTVIGNHDYSLALGGDCGCSDEYVDLTFHTRGATISKITDLQKSYLASLPERLAIEVNKSKMHLVHGSFKNPVYGYVAPNLKDNDIMSEMENASGIVLFGHSHFQMERILKEGLKIVNPGSVGFPKGGNPFAAYAIYEDGEFELKRVEYDINKMIKGLRAMPIPDRIKENLVLSIERGE